MFMRDYAQETKNRVAFIQQALQASGTKGIVFGNSGGKDCMLVGILCKMAHENTVGLIMPCGTKRNYASDHEDAENFAKKFAIESRYVDLENVRNALIVNLRDTIISRTAVAYMASRLRMTALYAVANSENLLVAGTGNRSERYMGYFTKWGDGAFDFNPVADLTATEVYQFLRHLNAPDFIFAREPSAGLFDGQTDEQEMGVTYESLDKYILTGETNAADAAIIDRFHRTSEHKRVPPLIYTES